MTSRAKVLPPGEILTSTPSLQPVGDGEVVGFLGRAIDVGHRER
jgi:hypothetical protein